MFHLINLLLFWRSQSFVVVVAKTPYCIISPQRSSSSSSLPLSLPSSSPWSSPSSYSIFQASSLSSSYHHHYCMFVCICGKIPSQNVCANFSLPQLNTTLQIMLLSLRAILCNSQAKWEMKNFDCGGMFKNALCSGCYFIVVMVTPIVCWWQKT